jgi:hypothetical protein
LPKSNIFFLKKLVFGLLLFFNRKRMHRENGGLMPLYLQNTMDVAAPEGTLPAAILI